MKNTGFDNKLVNKINKYKYFKTLLFLIIVIFGLLGEYAKQLLNERFGQHNIRSLILGAMIFCIYVRFIPFILGKNKSSLWNKA